LALASELDATASTLRQRRAALTLNQSGVTLGQALVLSRSIEGLPGGVPSTLAALEKSSVERLAKQFKSLSPYARLWAQDSVWIGPIQMQARPSFATFNSTHKPTFNLACDKGWQPRP
jgi:hypothetical protein